jgi:hypothetical protein
VTTAEAITLASEHLGTLKSHRFDLLTLSKPKSLDSALFLAKVVSKLSPLLGNMIEFNVVEFLNERDEFKGFGEWKRQDPGFPDAIFEGQVTPTPGFEIKAWFPLATEITARFKDSQNHFAKNNTYVAMLAWLPEHLVYGKPYIVDVGIYSARSVAQARDAHYHNPPDYLVIEPEDTSGRTRNLQQTNTAGYKWQGNATQSRRAHKIVESWGEGGKTYKPTREYQSQLRKLQQKFPYRLDTNFAKMDRIVHSGIEEFKTRVNGTRVNGMSISGWQRVLSSKDDDSIRSALKRHIKISK